MDITVSEEELEIICEALQQVEGGAEGDGLPDERLKDVRKLFQRLHTLRTAK
jgi:hypothetical protein